jgi:hypothetical protein
MVRAKFRVDEVAQVEGWGEHKTLSKITMSAVSGTDEENKKFFAATPAGKIEIQTVIPEVASQFDPGREFYVDFSPAEQT